MEGSYINYMYHREQAAENTPEKTNNEIRFFNGASTLHIKSNIL